MALVKVRYTGHHDEVVVTDPDTGERYVCKRNGTAEVPEALAGGPVKGTGLLAQTDAWERVDAERKADEPAAGDGDRSDEQSAPRRRGG